MSSQAFVAPAIETGPSVSVVGLGAMGLPVAENFARRGARVSVWNRSALPTDGIVLLGGRVAATPSDLDGEIIISMLPDIDQLLAVLDGPTGLRKSLTPGRILVVASTTSPRRVQELAESLAVDGISVVDAPMSGGVEGAREASLSFMVGCREDEFDRVRAVLELVGGTVERVGEAGAGSLAKLCNQIIVAGALSALGEALVLADRGGLDLEVVVRLLQGGLADSRVLRTKAGRVLAGDYEGGGSVRNQTKDLRYALESARELGAAVPLSAVTLGLFEQALNTGWAESDHSSVAEVIRAQSGRPI